MSIHVNRRSLMGAALVAPVAMVGAAPAAADTPVIRAYREWKRSLDAWEADMQRDGSDENGDRWCRATYQLADAVVDTPSEGPMDFAHKLMAYCFDGRHELDLGEGAERIWAEARQLVGVV